MKLSLSAAEALSVGVSNYPVFPDLMLGLDMLQLGATEKRP
jgi:hypothetical protein